ncbi:MAG: Hsp20/alpha crystallin family protein [Polyangiaceae bacterium]|jgi:HSP20 family protein|nr:Hsp20/alpha crystallin family protein [Polyangiaceae bacterium]
MSNIAVKKETLPAKPAAEWEPARFMRQFFGWDPFREMSPLMRADGSSFVPAFEVKETPEGYVFKADVPGVKESDLNLSLTGNRLTVSGRRDAEKEEKNDTFYAFERSFGSFTRSFTLPVEIDPNGARAEMKDGVLTVFVPRTPASLPKKIAVKSGTPSPT